MVKIRIHTDVSTVDFKKLKKFMSKIYYRESWRGYFKGQIFGQILYICWAIEIPIFKYFKKQLYNQNKSTSNLILAGSLTGIVCTTLIQPIDTLRTILIYDKSPTSLLKTKQFILNTKFYRGYLASLLMYGPGSALLFTMFTILNEKFEIKSQYSGFITGIITKTLIIP